MCVGGWGVIIKSSSGLWDTQAYFPMVDSDRGFAHLGQDQTAAGYTFLASGLAGCRLLGL